jgi:hypothetical protein
LEKKEIIKQLNVILFRGITDSHKYVRREGSQGNYKYFYTDKNGNEVEGNDKTNTVQIKTQKQFDDYIQKTYMDESDKILTGDPELNNALGEFRGANYSRINKALRSEGDESKKEFYKNMGEKINNYIEKNPLKSSITMYRGMSLDSQTLEGLKEGGVFESKNIFSLTSNENTAKRYVDNSGSNTGKEAVYLEIKTNKGDKISPMIHKNLDGNIQFSGEEQEFLSSYKNKYKIEKIEKKIINGEPLYNITMEVMK